MGISTEQVEQIISTPIELVASKTGVNGAVSASTNLDFVSGKSLATHLPLFYVFKYGSGTLGACVVKMKTAVADLTALTSLLTLTATQEVVASNSDFVTFADSGNLTVEVTTPSVGASTFAVYAYGIPRP